MNQPIVCPRTSLKLMCLAYLVLSLAVRCSFAQQTAQTDVRPLLSAQPNERKIKSEETHLYSLSLREGDALRVDLLEEGANVIVAVRDPQQKEIFEQDLGEGLDREKFVFIIERTGDYVLAVKAAPAQNGAYELSVSYGTATDEDKKNAVASVLNKEGAASVRKGTAEGIMGAFPKWEQAMAIFAETGDVYNEAELRGNLGVMYSMLGQKPKALEYDQKALLLNEKIGNKKDQSLNLANIATIYAQTGEKQKAVEYFEQALPLLRAIGDKQTEIITMTNLGNFYSQLGQQRKSLAINQQVVDVIKTLPDKRSQVVFLARVYAGISQNYIALSENAQGMEYARRGLEFAKDAGDLRTQASIMNNIGQINALLGERREALAAYQQALALEKTVADKESETTTLLNIGEAYSFLGETQKSLDTFLQAEELALSIGSKRLNAQALQSLGETYRRLGDSTKALAYLEQSLSIAAAIGARDIETFSLLTSGLIYEDLDKHEKAIASYDKALSIAKESGNRSSEVQVYINLSDLYERTKAYSRSIEYSQRAEQLAKAIGRTDLELISLNNLAGPTGQSGNIDEAKEYYKEAVLLARQVEDSQAEPKILTNLAYFEFLDGGNQRLGVFYNKIAVQRLQNLRANVRGLDKKTQQIYLRSIEVDYRFLADQLLKQSRFAEAQQTLNLFKDEQYFDFGSKMEIPSVTFTEREVALANEYNKKLEAAGVVMRRLNQLKRGIGDRELTAAETGEIAAAENAVHNAQEEFQSTLRSIAIQFAAPLDDKDKSPDIADVSEMQKALRETSAVTRQNTIAVYTVEGVEDYRALVVTPDRVFAVSTSIKKDDLNEKAQKLWNVLRSPKYDPRPAANELYKIVFAPIAAKLPRDTKTILWSLDGDLRYIPMAALYDGQHYLAERYENVIFTRADKERMTRAVSPAMAGTGMGSSEAHTVELIGDKFSASALPAVKAEMGRIFMHENAGGVLAGNILLDSGFTRAAMLSELKMHRPIVHIASHFRFEPGDEARSFLLLGDGTPFTLDEMKQNTDLFSGVDLLTLSACQTAAQKPDANGREVDGFAELAQRLGAGAVMASLWEVSDESTSELMARFYKAYRGGLVGESKAEALRQAQLALLTGKYNTPLGGGSRQLERESDQPIKVEQSTLKIYRPNRNAPFSHPFYWSPFILVGNWK